MALLDTRQRAGYLLLAVMLGHIILISAQVNSKSGVPVLEEVTLGLFAEVQRATTAIVSAVRHVWSGYVNLRHVQTENETLRRQLAAAEIQVQEQRALAGRSRGLSAALALRDRSHLRMTAAEVIAFGAAPDFRTLTIDKGTRQGLQSDMAVIAPAGVVGRVVVPSARAAKIQLLIDRNAGAGVLIERSRAQGVVIGTGDELLRMEYVSEVADVWEGDVVVTSGIDGIFPKGFVVGKVEKVEEGGGRYRQVLVRPAIDFSSLEEVLVVLTPPPADDAKETSR